jgi:hypothetical protein
MSSRRCLPVSSPPSLGGCACDGDRAIGRSADRADVLGVARVDIHQTSTSVEVKERPFADGI